MRPWAQGQKAAGARPTLSAMTSKAEVVSPPAQPKTPFFAPPRDVACCALKTVGGPPFKKKAVSTC